MKKKKIILISIAIIVVVLIAFYFISKSKSFYQCPTEDEYMTSGEFKWINCMPPVASSNKYCKREYSDWIKQNCSGIEFSD